MRWLLLVGALGGCDSVFGLSDPSLPRCVPKDGFESARALPTRDEAARINAFSLTVNERVGVYAIDGVNVEAEGESGTPVALPLEPMYQMLSVALDPVGEYMFFTASIEPLTILQARRDDTKRWVFDPKVPKGVIAGTPSDSKSNKPVRVIVRLTMNKNEFQEYERTREGDWVPVNDRFLLNAVGGANLSADGLVITYDGIEDGKRGVYVTDRDSFDETFGPGTNIFAGVHLQPQLLEDCSVLYAIDEGLGQGSQLTKYQR